MNIREFVKNIPLKAKIQCMYDYELYERKGDIGDCELRSRTEELMEILDARQSSFVLFCEAFIKEVYREFAYRWLDNNIYSTVDMK